VFTRGDGTGAGAENATSGTGGGVTDGTADGLPPHDHDPMEIPIDDDGEDSGAPGLYWRYDPSQGASSTARRTAYLAALAAAKVIVTPLPPSLPPLPVCLLPPSAR